jgi:hypothetical protein
VHEPPGNGANAYQWRVGKKIILPLVLRPEIAQKKATQEKDERAYGKNFRNEEMRKRMH